jgi:hypothetical protein
MAEQERDDKAEQQARAEQSKQEAEQLLKTQLIEPFSPGLFLGLLNGYLFFVTAFAAFGVLAFYSGHIIILKVVFFACIPMLVIAPIATARYFRSILKKEPTKNGTPGKARLVERIRRSSTGIFLVRLGNNFIFWLPHFALDIYMIAYAIRTFPSHPRFSLALVAFYTLMFCSLFTLVFINKLVNILYDLNDTTQRIISILIYTFGVAEDSRKYLVETMPSHNKVHEAVISALKANHAAIGSISNTIYHQPDHPSTKVDNCEGDEWINDG